MKTTRRMFPAVLAGFASGAWALPSPAHAASAPDILRAWYALLLELVRHTATYSPPVASRAFAYLGITAFEAVASGSAALRSLAGQLKGLTDVPHREEGAAYNDAAVIHAAMAFAVHAYFSNTGPTGQRAMKALEKKLQLLVWQGLAEDVWLRSIAHGKAVAEHVFAWSKEDGGAHVENLGFPQKYELGPGRGHWVPTSTIPLQQTPLLPDWGKNRTFAVADGTACPLPPPPAYSEDAGSAFHSEALEVHATVKALTPEQRTIARFWSDDPMLSPTPPGHWMWIAMQIFERESTPLEKTVEVLARLGMAIADGFIVCWASKYEHDLLRPVTYIKKVIDTAWEPLLITPPFPEYPSGHSTQSAAAAVVLARDFGENFAFEDATHLRDGLKPRRFESFWAAAEEAGISRLYGGIHFRAAIERGLEQGRCVGAAVNMLRTRV
jgi:PAP2 superfamily